MSYELRLSAARINSGTIDQGNDGTAEFTWTALRVEGCGSWAVSSGLAMGPCVLFDVGELRGTGLIQGNEYTTRGALWASPGISGRLDWYIVPALGVEVAAGAIAPIKPPEFLFSRNVVHGVDHFGWIADVGLSVRFL